METQMNSEQLTFEFLVENESFRAYVLKTNIADIRKWEIWFENHPQDRDLIQRASRMLFSVHQAPILASKYSTLDELAKLKQRIRFDKRKSSIRLWTKISGVAATIAVLVTLGIHARTFFEKKHSRGELAILTEVTVPKGVRKMVILSDGTKVWINSETTFKYPEKFSGKERKVYLDGEAYFDVAHNKEMPFSVITSEIKVNVIGTAFNIKSYTDDNTIETTLERGIVNIQRLNDHTIEGQEQIVLKPNQKYIFLKSRTKVTLEQSEKTERDFKRNNVDPVQSLKSGIEQVNETEIFTGWRDNKLSFKNERLDELKKRMERWYNIKIGIQDPELRSKRLSGTFVSETLNEALKALRVASDIKYTMRSDSVIIYSKKLN